MIKITSLFQLFRLSLFLSSDFLFIQEVKDTSFNHILNQSEYSKEWTCKHEQKYFGIPMGH